MSHLAERSRPTVEYAALCGSKNLTSLPEVLFPDEPAADLRGRRVISKTIRYSDFLRRHWR